MQHNYKNIFYVKIVLNYDRVLLLSSFIEILCCDVIYAPMPSVNRKLSYFVELLFFGVCGVSFNVLSRNVFLFFRRGSLDETVLRSVPV